MRRRTAPEMSDLLHRQIAEMLHSAKHILAVAHIRPDGDAVGSLLGLGLSLRAAGQKVDMLLADGVPAPFRHLPGSEQVITRPCAEYDVVVVLDSSDLQRTGGVLGERQPDLNIDHHATNLCFARVNLVDPQAVATCAILAQNLPRWGFPVSGEVASALLTGILTDTIGFRTSNMSPEVLRLAADLMEAGANLPELYRAGLVQKSFEAARYWGFGLERLQREDGLIWTTLLLADRQAAAYNGNDDADLINFLSSTDGDVIVLFNEQKGGKVKVSWRARPGLDISTLALRFGGGGHPAAAGAEISGTIEEVRERVLSETRAFLAAHRL